MAYIISFRPAESPIREAITKFGGQPVWIGEAQWPLSRETGNPMRFIAQIRLDASVFGLEQDKMAYLFMTDEDEEDFHGTFEYDGGENALVILPDGINNTPSQPLQTGPSLRAFVKVEGQKLLQPQDVEFFADLSEQGDVEGEENFENKISGSPHWLQSEEWPTGDKCLLVMQLDSAKVPFDINFGDTGVGYAFLSTDGKTGKFGWQCA